MREPGSEQKSIFSSDIITSKWWKSFRRDVFLTLGAELVDFCFESLSLLFELLQFLSPLYLAEVVEHVGGVRKAFLEVVDLASGESGCSGYKLGERADVPAELGVSNPFLGLFIVVAVFPCHDGCILLVDVFGEECLAL